jgi:hypothetical protein
MKETGGYAFPFFNKWGEIMEANDGMTMRDYFAAKATQSVIAKYSSDAHEYGDEFPRRAAQASYQYADAMLKERAK